MGVIDNTPLGSFTYQKQTGTNHYNVAVHLLKVTKVAGKFPEKGIRKTQWFLLKDAVCDAAQPGLRTLSSRLETVGV
ncbi:hypothetical protein PMI07_006621 [Rhizobium sp. CF080]|uniref:hypothetical protein n=1 Tax=Rhizobium sp. (strain CF080) TaxID=1144310 RepID=UPI0002715E74|nr:hypothetical protein [Rhizobium sp. CF080]EUB98307.1 hypothetical protein PMI07_006621 [Rhizobium sp. CF080]